MGVTPLRYKRDDKPGYVADGHLSRPAVASRLKQPTWNWRAAICSCAVLLRMGFTYAPSVAGRAVVSYTALPPLPQIRSRWRGVISAAVHFCCTVPGVTSAGRYPASCPVKPGLSSPGPFRLPGSGRLSRLHGYSNTQIRRNQTCQTSKHPPPMNSLTREFIGMSSDGIGRK